MLGDFPGLVRVGVNCHVCLHRKVRRPSNEEEDLIKACKHCLDDEAKKIREAASGKMSSLDAYLTKHLGSAHTID